MPLFEEEELLLLDEELEEELLLLEELEELEEESLPLWSGLPSDGLLLPIETKPVTKNATRKTKTT